MEVMIVVEDMRAMAGGFQRERIDSRKWLMFACYESIEVAVVDRVLFQSLRIRGTSGLP